MCLAADWLAALIKKHNYGICFINALCFDFFFRWTSCIFFPLQWCDTGNLSTSSPSFFLVLLVFSNFERARLVSSRVHKYDLQFYTYCASVTGESTKLFTCVKGVRSSLRFIRLPRAFVSRTVKRQFYRIPPVGVQCYSRWL